ILQRTNSRKDGILLARIPFFYLQHPFRRLSAHLAQDHRQPAGECTPMDLAELAARHPRATIVCGHSGGDWERGLRVIRPQKNVYADIAGAVSRKLALRLAIPPSQHPPGPQRVPAAGFTKLFQFEVGLALVTILQRPSAVLALAAADNLDRLGEAWVSLRVDRLEIVQSAENVVVPPR